MGAIIQDIKDISDSRELLESRPPLVIPIFTGLLIALLIAALLWTYFSEIDIYVKADGIVRPEEKISTIKNKVSGNVENVYYTEGMKVRKGDTLYTIEHSNLDFVKLLLSKQLDKSKELIPQKNMEVKIVEMQKTLNGLKSLKKSIVAGENLVDDKDSEYYLRYNVYTLNLQKLKTTASQKKTIYEQNKTLGNAGAIAANEVRDARIAFEIADLELQNYISDYMHNLRSEIEQNNKSLLDLNAQLDNIKISDESNMDKLENDIRNSDKETKDSVATAPIDGVVNVITEVNKGDFLQGGIDVATIVPENNNQYKIQLYVSNKDIADITEGQKIKCHFLALPYREYGEFTGKVTKVGADAKSGQQSGTTIYSVEAVIDNKPAYSYKGVESEIKVGMACEAYVITKTKKILFYLLEKINLRD